MKKYLPIIAAALVLSACSGGKGGEAAGEGKPAAKKEVPIKVDMSVVKIAGRWEGEKDAEGKQIVLDLASTGGVSLEFRRTTANGAEVLETASGKARFENNVLSGNLTKALPTTGMLAKSSSWTMSIADKTGQLQIGSATYALTWTGL